MSYIVDISEWQEPDNINYDIFAKELSMAICRVQYGSSHIDNTYPTHMSQLAKRGVPCGAYAFVRGISTADMAKEAIDFYTRATSENPLFYALDIETITMTDMRSGINAFIAELRKHTGNKKIGAYVANELYTQMNLDLSKFDFVWIPKYGANNGTICCEPGFNCDLHQYTSVGKVPGYSGNLDLNRLMNNRTIKFFIGDVSKPVMPTVKYQAHVQNIGWQKPVSDGDMAGTTGQNLRMESLAVTVDGLPNIGLSIEGHVQNIGWQGARRNGEPIGTVGRELRLEAVKMSLINAPGYHIQYQAHVQNKGWLDWVQDGAIAGTTGEGLRLEAIRIKITK